MGGAENGSIRSQSCPELDKGLSKDEPLEGMVLENDRNFQEVLIGIDVGSTNIRCVVYALNAKILFKATRPTRKAHQIKNLWGSELEVIEPEVVWQLVCEVCQEAAQFLRSGTFILRGIAVACIGCTAICLGENKQVLYPLILFDADLPNVFKKYQQEMGPEKYFTITGYPLDPSNISFLLAKLREHDPANYFKISTILSIGGFINFKLTGEIGHEYSTAAAMALWDQQNSCWWQAFLDDIELESAKLGHPVWSGAYLGRLTADAADQTGLPLTDVYLGGHDYLCAALATGCVTPDRLLNVNGTYEIMATFHRKPQNRPEIAQYRTLIDHHVIPNYYSLMIEAIGSGQIEWLKSWVSAPDWNQLSVSIEALSPGVKATQEIFIPQIYGRFFPKRIFDARGGYVGFSSETNSTSILLTTIEGLCFQARQIFEFLQGTNISVAGQNTLKILEVGGASQNPIWMQIKADILGKTLCVPHIQEASALGAALLAGIGAGVYRDYHQASQITGELGQALYEPRPERHAFYTEIFREVYLPLLDTLLQVDQKISNILSKNKK